MGGLGLRGECRVGRWCARRMLRAKREGTLFRSWFVYLVGFEGLLQVSDEEITSCFV